MSSSSSADVLIVGASTAGLRAAEAVTRHAPELRVVVVGKEVHLPYELPPLSKIALDEVMDVGNLVYPLAADLKQLGVDFRLGAEVTSLDTSTRTVVLADGERLSYNALVIATGCEAVVPPLFAGATDTHTLRRFEDAVALRRAVADPSRAVAIVGAGFIGGELASTLAKAGRTVSLIDRAPQPLIRMGAPIADAYTRLHRDAGVNLLLGVDVVEIAEGEGGRVLVLDDGRRVAADVIMVGVGVRPSLAWLSSAELTYDNGIVADATLRAGEDVFVAGDIVRWPNARFGAAMRVEHWTNAAEQGRAAGLNAARLLRGESREPFASVPYFWSDQHGVRMQFAGFIRGDEEIVEQVTADGTIYLYRAGDTVTGVFAFDRRSQFVALRAKLRRDLSWADAAQIVFAGEGSPVG